MEWAERLLLEVRTVAPRKPSPLLLDAWHSLGLAAAPMSANGHHFVKPWVEQLVLARVA